MLIKFSREMQWLLKRHNNTTLINSAKQVWQNFIRSSENLKPGNSENKWKKIKTNDAKLNKLEFLGCCLR